MAQAATVHAVAGDTGARALRLPVAAGAAVVSGLFYWAAFPGVDVWPLTFVAWVPLLVALRGQSTRRAALLGWVTGLSMNVAGFLWLEGMLQSFSGFPAAVCFLFLLIVCAYQGGRAAFLGWIYGRATARGWPREGVFVGAFVASELAYPLLFPWYYGATIHEVPLFTQVGAIGGPIGVGLVLVAANLGIAELVLAALDRRTVRAPTVLASGAVVAAAALYGAFAIRSVERAMQNAPQANVGVAQANMGLMEKRTEYAEGLRRHTRMTEALRSQGADFVVWSETSAMRPVRDESYQLELRNVSRSLKIPAIFGAVIVKPVPDEREYVIYNSAIASDEDGAIEGRYDKEFLLMFGEYLPFGDTFPILHKWSPNSGHFTPGTSLDPLPLVVRGVKHEITPLICYEDVLPRFTNDAVRNGNPDLLVNITNDAWFGDTAEPWEHLALAELRAVEHRRYLVRGTNSGVSAVIDPVGRVVAHTGTFREETLLAPIHWMRARTIYEFLGDWPWLALTLVALAGAFGRRPAAVRAVSRA